MKGGNRPSFLSGGTAVRTGASAGGGNGLTESATLMEGIKSATQPCLLGKDGGGGGGDVARSQKKATQVCVESKKRGQDSVFFRGLRVNFACRGRAAGGGGGGDEGGGGGACWPVILGCVDSPLQVGPSSPGLRPLQTDCSNLH